MCTHTDGSCEQDTLPLQVGQGHRHKQLEANQAGRAKQTTECSDDMNGLNKIASYTVELSGHG